MPPAPGLNPGKKRFLPVGKWSFDDETDNRFPGRLPAIVISALVKTICTVAP